MSMTKDERDLLLALAAYVVADGCNEGTARISALAHALDADATGDVKPAEPSKSKITTGAEALRSVGRGS
jgi:hypothetical protein